MKKNLFALAAIALCVASTMTSCSKEEESEVVASTATTIESGSTLSGDLSASATLPTGASYSLSGIYRVKSGAVLTIGAGVTITAIADDTTVDYIIVEPGAQIISEATIDSPIIMTADVKNHGAWGGLHVCGYAKVNNGSGLVSEIGDTSYGGDNDADNSGVYKNMRIEYAGYQYYTDKECNGFTFYGVGAGTTLENLVAYKGSDDGFEWFGGCVNATNLVSIDNEDDSFDWTYGFTGTITNAYAEQLSTNCDLLIEGDNNSNNEVGVPTSCPTFKSAVLIGIDGAGSNGVRIRRGSKVILDDVTVYGKTNSFDFQSEKTNEYLILCAETALVDVTSDKGVVNQDSNASTYDNVNATILTGLTIDGTMTKPALPSWVDTSKSLFVF